MSSEEITEVGERHVIVDLTAKGFTCARHRESTCSSVIEVFRGTELICLVRAKTTIPPAVPEAISGEESHKLRNTATLLGGGAWLAQVKINEAGQCLEPISYTQVS